MRGRHVVGLGTVHVGMQSSYICTYNAVFVCVILPGLIPVLEFCILHGHVVSDAKNR